MEKGGIAHLYKLMEVRNYEHKMFEEVDCVPFAIEERDSSVFCDTKVMLFVWRMFTFLPHRIAANQQGRLCRLSFS